MICCGYLLIDYSVVVDHPIFEYVLGCEVEDVNLKMIDFDIKVENENDIEIILSYSNIELYIIEPILLHIVFNTICC